MGSSFIFIKLSVSGMSTFSYVRLRSLLALLSMIVVYIIYTSISKRTRIFLREWFNGFTMGSISSVDLYLQGEEARYVSLATNAFYYGSRNTSCAHIYCYEKKIYGILDLFSLIFALGGLYIHET